MIPSVKNLSRRDTAVSLFRKMINDEVIGILISYHEEKFQREFSKEKFFYLFQSKTLDNEILNEKPKKRTKFFFPS